MSFHVEMRCLQSKIYWKKGTVTSCPKFSPTLVWWQLWNFSVVQLKFNKRIFLYLVRSFDWGMSKIRHFQFSESIWRPEFNKIFLKILFLSEYPIRRTIFIDSVLNINHSQGNLFSKMVPNFWRLDIKQSYKVT